MYGHESGDARSLLGGLIDRRLFIERAMYWVDD